MRAVKIVSIVILVYVGIVVTFESLLGYFQPAAQSTLIITTMDADGTAHDRVVARLESNGQLYVARNHWPRAWYSRALEHPNVRVTMDGRTGDYLAVPASAEEHRRVNSDHRLGTVFRILTGFPPRYFFRLDPR